MIRRLVLASLLLGMLALPAAAQQILVPSSGGGGGATLGANTFTDTQTIAQATATHSLLVSTGGSNTGSDTTSAVNLAWTLNTSGSPDVFKLAVTDTARGASTKLVNIYGGASGTTSEFSVDRNGAININNGGIYEAAGNSMALGDGGVNLAILYASGGLSGLASFNGIALNISAGDTFITRRAAASLLFGNADAASPVAQTLSVQSVVAGTTNTAGAAWTLDGSIGTGTGVGGDIVFKTAPAGTTGTSQNALITALTVKGTDGSSVFGATANLKGYAVGSLPAAGTAGRIAFVNDQMTACPVLGGGFTGGGAVACLAFDNGSAWIYP